MSNLILCTTIAFCVLVTSRASADDQVDFSRDVQPILSDTCFKCHGPDEAQREADLRLDTRDGLFGHRDGVRIVAPSHSARSELIRRIVAQDDDQMPPVTSGLTLSRGQIELLRKWVEQGAPWSDHWAFSKPVRPVLPPVTPDSQHAIDVFVARRLSRQQLTASAPATRTTLLRRATFDLTGLPPAIEELDEFLADDRPDAFPMVLDRLLASPRFGERMAWPWLNAARYADTSGYQNDGPRDMWRWRDWVIAAFNANMPYDRFTIEQLAGDLLPNATLDQQIATGFNRNHRGNAEGGIIPEEYQVEYVVDRVDTTATVWLGLTLGCARCHDHKYDPLKQREFYEVFAFFNNVPEYGRTIKEGNSPPLIKAPTPAQSRQLRELDQQIEALDQQCRQLEPGIDAALAVRETIENPEARELDWHVRDGLVAAFPLHDDLANIGSPDATPASTAGVARFENVDGHQALRLGKTDFVDAGDLAQFGYFDRFTVSVWVRPDEPGGTLVSRMTRKPQGDGWSLHLEDGRLQLNLVKRWLDDSIRVQTESNLATGRWQHVLATYDGSRVAAGIRIYIDGEQIPLVVEHDFLNQSMANDEPLRIGAGHSDFAGALSDVRIFGRDLTADEAGLLATRETVTQLLRIPAEQRTARQRAKLHQWALSNAPAAIQQPFRLRREWQRQRRAFHDAIPTVMVMRESEQIRKTHVLERGSYAVPREEVRPGVPAVFPPLDTVRDRPNRLDFARWLVSAEHPLTSRVAVNRAWQTLFGHGFVRTVEDFGVQGEPPTHPQLLDWLAVEFQRREWDVKGLYRTLMNSAAYQRSSRSTSELLERDPDNRLLARGPRFRLSAEMVRDQALAAAGLLTERLGGPSVKPYQPDGLWAEIATDADYDQSHGADLYRRSLYTYWKRTVAPPTMLNFDAGAREMCAVRQPRTNTPLQALTLMNETSFVEAARVIAQRCLADPKLQSDRDRLFLAFRTITSRRPTDVEERLLRQALKHHLTGFQDSPKAAESLSATGEFPVDPTCHPAQLAAWTVVIGLILNLDETVTRE